MTLSKTVFWAHAVWDDATTHGEAVHSPWFVAKDQLREWTDALRRTHGARAGFVLSAWERSYLLDDKGDPLAGSEHDSSLMVREDRLPRAVHERCVADAAEQLKGRSAKAIGGQS